MSDKKGDALLDALVSANQTSPTEKGLYYANGFLVALVPTCANY